ncbi:MAG TPA: hypothetical protein VKA38_14070 [Draconibacterium sp.]|nr:hypothetical protein [Draconibacterium sp.]
MPQKLNQFSNGGSIEFDKGSFDEWCVYITKPNGERIAPSDVQYFSRLKKLGNKYGAQKIHDDFVVIYNRTTAKPNPDVFRLISILSKFYDTDVLEMEIWFNVLYAGMIAEENKEKAILKKRVKRLGIHQVLIDGIEPEVAAGFSKGIKWQQLDRLMKAKGF